MGDIHMSEVASVWKNLVWRKNCEVWRIVSIDLRWLFEYMGDMSEVASLVRIYVML